MNVFKVNCRLAFGSMGCFQPVEQTRTSAGYRLFRLHLRPVL